jgi:hypothetical protein
MWWRSDEGEEVKKVDESSSRFVFVSSAFSSIARDEEHIVKHWENLGTLITREFADKRREEPRNV